MTPVLAIALALAAAFNAIDALPVGVFYDDALYTILGKSIASGAGYRYLNVPGQPLATHYPPGYPLLLAALWRVAPSFPENVALFKAVNALLVGAVAYFTYRFARVRLAATPHIAAGVALAGTAAIPLLVLSSAVMSEVLFLALLMPWLLAAERRVDTPRVQSAMWLSLFGALLFYVRAHAIVVVPALVVTQLLARNRRAALVSALVGMVALLPWFLWVAAHDAQIPSALRGAYGSYAGWLLRGVRDNGIGIVIASMRDNAVTVGAIIVRSFAVLQRQPFQILALLAVLALVAAGAMSLYARARVTLVFLTLYFIAVLAWPFSPLRFVWGVWPLVILVLFAGMQWSVRHDSRLMRGRAIRWTGIAATAMAVVGMLLFNVRGYANAWWTTVSRSVTPRIQPQLEWVAAHTTASDVVVADDEGAVFLYTGRHAVPANTFTPQQYFLRRPAAEDARILRDVVHAFRATYVVAWADPTIQAAELLTRARPVMLVRADTIRGGRVYRARR